MEQNSTKYKNKNHAIMLPVHLQGHVNPFIQLSLNLASKNNTTITFLTLDHVNQAITKANGHNPNHDLFESIGSNLDIRYRVVSDGFGLDYDRNGNLMEYLEWYLNGGLYNILVKEIGEIVEKSTPKVNVLIFDTFYPWGGKIAKETGVKFASFWTEPAVVFSLYYHAHLLRQHGHLDCLDTRKDPIDYIPGITSIEPKDLMSYYQDKDTTTNMHKLIFQAFQDIRSADFILCNSTQELEPNTISTLQKILPFYPIGPILLSGPTKAQISTSFWAESDCSEWLEHKSNGSVLYVSFGSIANFTKNDVMEIAHGLMDSNVDFIWVLRPCTVLEERDNVLPVGFEDEVRDRGIVVPWTDQIEVLSHQAVGGFLTHCGWNSVLESVWHEVPMLCFPVFTDQFTNRKLVVDDWNIGLNLCNGGSSIIRREEIATQIKYFMNRISEDLKINIIEKRNLLQSSLEDGGSSTKYVEQFMEDLSN